MISIRPRKVTFIVNNNMLLTTKRSIQTYVYYLTFVSILSMLDLEHVQAQAAVLYT